MYSKRSGLVLAFHGCDQSVVGGVISGATALRNSTNKYDWLGHGVYFWDNSPSRALEFATSLSETPRRNSIPIKNPAVIGAVINLGLCLDLLDYKNLSLLKESYGILSVSSNAIGKALPINKVVSNSEDLLLRELDCAVIETLHQFRKQQRELPFDSVRGVFWEGKKLYQNAGFREKDHIQLCIRNPNCIKGYFLPRDLNTKFSSV